MIANKNKKHVQNKTGIMIMATEVVRNNLSNAIFEGNWEDAQNYLNEIQQLDEFGGTALHTAYFYHNTTPYNIFDMLINAYPKAATIQNSLGFTPLHYSRKGFSDECTMLLLNVAPETVCVQNYTTGCTPLHYALKDCRSCDLIQAMITGCPSALEVTNFLGQTPLDCFFLHWCAHIQILLNHCKTNNKSPEQILDTEIVNTRRNIITVRYVHRTMCILLKLKVIIEENNNNHSATSSNTSNMPIILYSAFYLHYCPWLYCMLLAYVHPEHILQTTNNNTENRSLSILLQTVDSNITPLESNVYERIYRCSHCRSSTIKLYKGTRGYFCTDCSRHKIVDFNSRNANIVRLHRDEELERFQFIYYLLRGDPSLCAIY